MREGLLEASVVMPVRDAAATLDAALASVLGQAGVRFEVLVVVNGSSDASWEIARGWAGRDARVRVLESTDSGGVVAAANAGAAQARGEVLVRMDADDVAAAGRLAAQCGFLRSHPEHAAVTGRVAVLDPLGEGICRYVEWANSLDDAAAIAAGRFIESPVINPASALRREVFQQLGGYQDTRWAEDHDLWLRLLEHGGKIGRVSELVLHWRDSAGRLTRSDPRYASGQVWEMKAHYLARLEAVRQRGVAIAGAGPIGKRLARLLGAQGVQVHGLFDVSPRRIGQKIAGLEVAPSEAIGQRWRHAVLIGAVGLPGVRHSLREIAAAARYREGDDFWLVC